MTKPNTKHSSVFSRPTRQKTEYLIHKKYHPKLYHISYNSDCSPYLIWTLIRNNAKQNPALLFKNSKQNGPSLDDLAKAALSKVDSLSQALKNFEDALESMIVSSNKAVTTNLSDSFKDLDTEELELALQSLDDDSSEQTIPGQEAIDNSDITE